MNAATIEKEALQLPEAQRAQLVDRLLESLNTPPSVELRRQWISESAERFQAFQEGKLEAMDALLAMSRLRARFAP